MPTTRSRSLDVALAAAVTVVGVAEIWVPFSSRQGEGRLSRRTVVLALTGLALTQRREHPLAVGRSWSGAALRRRRGGRHPALRRPVRAGAAGAGRDRLPLRLTERELGVLRLVARGLPNTEIGRRLFLSEATVKTYVSRLLANLAVRDRVQLAVLAYETGLVRPGQNLDPSH